MILQIAKPKTGYEGTKNAKDITNLRINEFNKWLDTITKFRSSYIEYPGIVEFTGC